MAIQEEDIHRPPTYFATDWDAAWESVKHLEALKPRVAITGHGKPMSGEDLQQGLSDLSRDFDTIAIPKHGDTSNSILEYAGINRSTECIVMRKSVR